MTALTAVVLPDGTSWQFQYNDSYGDITEIVLPTGGTISYTYAFGQDSCSSGAWVRSIVSRTLFDGTSSHTWHYNWGSVLNSSLTATDPLGNDAVYNIGSGCVVSSIKSYSGSQSANVLLRTTSQTFQTLGGDCVDSGMNYSYPLPSAETTTWGNGASVQQAFTYDSGFTSPCNDGSGVNISGVYGLVTQKSHSDYYTGSVVPILSVENFSYQALTSSNPSYLSPSNLLTLVSKQTVTDGSGNLCSETDYAYDGSTGADSSSISEQHVGITSGFVRGNLTGITRQLFSGGTTSAGPCTSSAPTETAVSTVQHIFDTGMFHYSTDPLSNNTQTDTYSSADYGAYPTQICNALTQCSTYTYDFDSGVMLSMQDANSQMTHYPHYDCMLRPEEVDHPDGSEETMSYLYAGSSGSCNGTSYTGATYSLIVNSSTTYTQTTTLDGLGRTIQTSSSVPSSTCSSDHAYVDTTYDPDGRVLTVSNPDCTSTSSDDVNTTVAYDAIGRQTSVAEQDGSMLFTSYVNNCATSTDELGKARKACVDGLGRTTGVWEDPFGVNYETDYSYDPLGDLLQAQQKGSSSAWRTRTFAYDSLSRVVCAANPEIYVSAVCPTSTSGAVLYAYDSDSNLTSKTAPEEDQTTESTTVTTSYTYDHLNRLTQTSYSDGTTPTLTYGYDTSSLTCPATCANVGRQTAMSDGAGSEAWTFYYNSTGTGLLDQRTTNGVTKTATYTFNPGGTLSALEYPSGRTITYTINDALQPTSAEDITNGINYATSALYTPFGSLSSLTNGSTLLTSLYYNARMQPCRIAVNSSGSAPGFCGDSNLGNVMDLTYNFNAGVADNGNVTAIANNNDGTRSQTFTYDSLNRVATAASSTFAASQAHCWGESFGFDAWGNLSSIGAISSAYSGCTQPSLSLPAFAADNHLPASSGFGYDAAGNLTSGSTTGPYYTYDANGQMTQAASFSTAGYVYDGNGRRVEKTAGGSAYELYWYDTGGNVLAETDGSGNLLNEYIFFGGKRIARRKVQ